MKRNRKLWFRAKRFGWGWYPVSWQGWVVTLVYALAYVILGLLFGAFAPSVVTEGGSVLEGSILFLSIGLLLTASLLAICYRYGEKPGWRWG
ncbi:MAG: hypothetical protein AAB582_02895 [Patescibacteria group bacterium]